MNSRTILDAFVDAIGSPALTSDAQSPHHYGVPHPRWRIGQRESVDWAAGTEPSQIAILEAPTGSGKSSIVKALSYLFGKTDVLTRSKALQHAYGGEYAAFMMMGMDNYLCVHPKGMSRHATAGECLFAEKMSDCPTFARCLYHQAKEEAMANTFVATNYAYWVNSYAFKRAERAWLAMDEGHNLSDIVLSYAGIKIGEKQRVAMDLPPFPKIVHSRVSSFNPDPPEDIAREWLQRCAHVLRTRVGEMEKRTSADEDFLARMRRIDLFARQVERVVSHLQVTADWFIRAGPDVIRSTDEESESGPGLIVRPLTARYHWPFFFSELSAGRRLIMSATIGNIEVFTRELGITPDSFVSRVMPDQWPASSRPIFDLGCPKLGRKSPDSAWRKQAEIVAAAIHSCPASWSGLLHVTSWRAAADVILRLSKHGLADRLFLPPRVGTDRQIQAWEHRKRRHPGSLMVSPSMYEGFNGLDEQINILLKTPYPNYGDEFERARRDYDGKFALQRTAWRMEQAKGRTRRGREQDYDLPNERRGFVAFADGRWTDIKGYFSQSTLDAIVPFHAD